MNQQPVEVFRNPCPTATRKPWSDSVPKAEAHLKAIGCEQGFEEVVADKGYHAVETLELCEALGVRTYIPEPKRKSPWSWINQTPDHGRAVRLNCQRMNRARGKQLQSGRGELCERTFAHVCETGGMRRSWLTGFIDVTTRYVMAAAAHNLGRLLRTLTGVGKPLSLQGAGLWAALETRMGVSEIVVAMAGQKRAQNRRMGRAKPADRRRRRRRRGRRVMVNGLPSGSSFGPQLSP